MPATKQKTVTYTSFRKGDEFRKSRPRELRLVRFPGPDLRDNSGALSGMGAELVYEFAGGVLHVTDELVERDRLYMAERAERLHIDFDGDPGTIEWLESRPEFGLEFFRQEERAPEATPVLAAITRAVLDGDLPALVDIYEEESSGWQRPEVLEPCGAAIEKLEALGAAESATEGTDGVSAVPGGPEASGGV